MASLGHEVTGVDVDEAKVEALTSGRPPFFEPGLSELLVRAQEKGGVELTTDVSRAAEAQVHFVCVGTPQKPGEFAADVTYVDAAVDSVREDLTSASVVVGKSTVPVGTDDPRVGISAASEKTIRSNTEFLREGDGVDKALHQHRLVYGGRSAQPPQRGVEALAEVYEPIVAEDTPRMSKDF